jgi:DNA polymerase III subunit beta
MQIILEREKLLVPVGLVAGVVERRQTLPILSYLLLRADEKGVRLTGTDLEVELLATTEGRVDTGGEVTIPARKFLDICRALPEAAVITLTKQDGRVVLKSGRSRFTLATLAPSDFPTVEANTLTPLLTMPAQGLKRVLECTAFCMAQQDVRYYLNGLYLEVSEKQLRVVATDGHRMAITDEIIERGPSKPVHCIVPRKAIQEILRLLPSSNDLVATKIDVNHLQVEVSGLVMTSKLIDGKFPDYTKVIPTTQNKIVVLKQREFRECLSRVAILANEKYRGVRLNLERGKLAITAHNPEQEEAVEEVETAYAGEALEIGFNVNYLLEATGAIHSPEVQLGLSDASSSCTLKAPDRPETQYIVMPMRL